MKKMVYYYSRLFQVSAFILLSSFIFINLFILVVVDPEIIPGTLGMK